MKAGDLLINGEAELTNRAPKRRASDDPAMCASGNAAGELRSVVEERFMRMTETHDRIRTELLYSPQEGE